MICRISGKLVIDNVAIAVVVIHRCHGTITTCTVAAAAVVDDDKATSRLGSTTNSKLLDVLARGRVTAVVNPVPPSSSGILLSALRSVEAVDDEIGSF